MTQIEPTSGEEMGTGSEPLRQSVERHPEGEVPVPIASPDLSFRRIEIRRMPGFPSGGFTVEDLCPGVNIIYGPNASGKTTLSRAIQRLLRVRDGRAEQHSLAAVLELRGRQWTIDYDVGRVRCQREGADEDLPTLAPAEIKDRYVLALHDLIRSEDGHDLAQEIVRESAGGYDLAAARTALGFQKGPSAKRGATKELDAAIDAARETRRRQDALLDEEKGLAYLRRRQAEARAAAVRRGWLEKALAYLDALERRREARAQLAVLPQGIAAMTGDEIAQLAAIDEEMARADSDRRDEEIGRQAAETRLAESGLPQEGVPAELPAALRLKCQRLRQLVAEFPVHERDLAKASDRMDQARRSLGPEGASDQLDLLPFPDATAVEQLGEFARRAEALRADASAATALGQWLGADSPWAGQPLDAIQHGVRLLQQWIAVEDAAGEAVSRRKPVLLGAAIGAAAVSLLLAAVAHWSWLLLLPVAAAIAVAAFWPQAAIDRRASICWEFESLDVGRPGDWTAAEARAYLVQLQRRAAEVGLHQERAARWSGLEQRRLELQRSCEELHRQGRLWAERLGIDLDVAGREHNEAWLYLLAANLNRLHDASQARAAAAASLEATIQQRSVLLSEIVTAIRPFGFQETVDSELAAEQVEQLARRQQEHQEARSDLAERSRALERIEQHLGQLAARRAALFERVGLAPGDDAAIRRWADLCPEYRRAAETLRLAEHDLEATRAAIAGQPELAAMPRESLVEEQQRCVALAATLDSLTQQIGSIEGRIDDAKKGTDLEAALARQDQCREVLRQQRERDYDGVVGNVLADFLAQQQHDEELPGVVRHARELFVGITHGRYRLDVDLGDPPGFRALDTHRGVGLALEELSSGTRLQLLLAVRVAFVQRQEQGLKLPLILDETLGNSDERRAAEIIEAAIEVCRAGRQVFYLTAQHDEVGKWQAVLRGHGDVPSRLVDLAEIRRFSQSERAPPMDFQPPPVPEVPPPGDLDWLSYGQLLDVPPLDREGQIGGIHLWYLVDDPPALHRLLRHGINRWGQLQALAQYGHDRSLDTESEVYRRAEAAARLIEGATRYWRIGRGRPVDRQVLVDCPAVTEKFVDRVSDLAAQVNGDAKQLIARLAEGHVKGFRTEKRNELREYLVEQGHLDEHEVLSAEQIGDHVRTLAFPDMEKGLLDAARFERLLTMVLGKTA
jgi:energy-coupling factor transporter ATP-binding protein EcfA2